MKLEDFDQHGTHLRNPAFGLIVVAGVLVIALLTMAGAGVYLTTLPDDATTTLYPTYTLQPTYTPFPEPNVLDWHIQYATKTQFQIFDCKVFVSSDQPDAQLINPLSVNAQVTWLSPHIISEISSMLSINDTLPTFPENRILLLIRLNFETSQNIYEPQVWSPDFYPEALFSLDEIAFEFKPSADLNDERVILTIADKRFFPDSMKPLPRPMKVGTFYPIWIDLADTALKDFEENTPFTLQLSLVMFPPFLGGVNCQQGNQEIFTLKFDNIIGNARDITLRYGNLPEATYSVAEIRQELLVSLPIYLQTLTTDE